MSDSWSERVRRSREEFDGGGGNDGGGGGDGLDAGDTGFGRWFGFGLIGLGVLGLGWTAFGTRSLDEHLRRSYECKPERRGVLECTADTRPARVASDVADRYKPADRRISPSGVFLRYRRHMLGITNQSDGTGSLIRYANERDGYRHFYHHTGGWWGTYSGPGDRYDGPGDDFRGGGPGGGK